MRYPPPICKSLFKVPDPITLFSALPPFPHDLFGARALGSDWIGLFGPDKSGRKTLAEP